MQKSRCPKLSIIASLLLSTTAGLSAQAAPGITWKLAFLKWGAKDFVAMPFSRPLAMTDGDKFQVRIQDVNTPAYCYVLYNSADGKVASLFQSSLQPSKALSLPSEKESFQVSPPDGAEKIFVIVTAERQAPLEKLLQSPDNVQAILDEVARIRQSTSSLGEAPEKPAPIGGVTRGRNSSVQATEYDGQSSYVKTIRIEH